MTRGILNGVLPESRGQIKIAPFLILQLGPEPEAADSEYAAILRKAGLAPAQTHRIRLDVEPLPARLNLQSYGGIIVGGRLGCVSDAPSVKTPTEAKIEAAVLAPASNFPEPFSFAAACFLLPKQKQPQDGANDG